MFFLNKVKTIFVIVSIVSAFFILPAGGQEQEFEEHEVKAFVIYNLAKFIEWPINSFDALSTLTIYIIGDAPFGTYHDSLSGKLVQGKRVVIKHINSTNAIKNVGILFISASEKEQLHEILKRLSNQPILTISDTPSFAKKGVMINLLVENEKIKFEINNEVAKQAGLRISANLLKMGRIISP